MTSPDNYIGNDSTLTVEILINFYDGRAVPVEEDTSVEKEDI